MYWQEDLARPDADGHQRAHVADERQDRVLRSSA